MTEVITESDNKHWDVCRTVELGAKAEDIWELISGFYTMHLWHPDIEKTEVPEDQTNSNKIRRELTFPGQPITTEELVSLNNDDFHYKYKWFKGPWGEEVKNYHSSLRVIRGDLDNSCIVQWQSTFDNPKDAISDFYLHGFNALKQQFPITKGE